MLVGFIIIPILVATIPMVLTTTGLVTGFFEPATAKLSLQYISVIGGIITLIHMTPRITVECRRLNAMQKPIALLVLYYFFIILVTALLYLKLKEQVSFIWPAIASAALVIELLWFGGFFNNEPEEKQLYCSPLVQTTC
jgi:uncharacterized membrane protein YhaH (DUF805 family)